MQPFRQNEKVIIEKRGPDGRLDFTDPQPPMSPIMPFDKVYDLFFREFPEQEGSWENLSKWLQFKGWTIRAATWER